MLLQRLAATLATSSNHNSMELALLAVRNHVNDAILHAQLHGPRITATVSRGDDGLEGTVHPQCFIMSVLTYKLLYEISFGFRKLLPDSRRKNAKITEPL